MPESTVKTANERQVGGSHYREAGKIQHWDVAALLDLDYYQGQITKYVCRWKRKGGLQDLEKARHFLDKYIELERSVVEGVHLVEDTEHGVSCLCGSTAPKRSTRDVAEVTCYKCLARVCNIDLETDGLTEALIGKLIEALESRTK